MKKLVLITMMTPLVIMGCGGSSGGGGSNIPAFPDNVGDTRNDGVFAFNNAPPERYSQIDRMGVPVVASVVIRNVEVDGQNQRDRFNEGDPADDGDFATDIVPIVDRLHRELDDDLCAVGLTPCSRRDDPNGNASSVCDFPDGDNFSITNCAVQAVPQIVPDVLTYDLSKPDGFPNGRRLQDPVVDQVLAVAFLDINEGGDCNGEPCSGESIANPPAGSSPVLPLNPSVNERPILDEFPFLAQPHAVERQ